MWYNNVILFCVPMAQPVLPEVVHFEEGYAMPVEDLCEFSTKASRREKRRSQHNHDYLMKKAIRAEKAAFGRSRLEKEQAKREATTRHKLYDFRRESRTYRQLAAEITAYIIDEYRGEIKGESLEAIYGILAEVLLPDEHEPIDQIKKAVAFGCHKLWLMQREIHDNESCCLIPFLKRDAA